MDRGEMLSEVDRRLKNATFEVSDAVFTAQDAGDPDLAEGLRTIYADIQHLIDRLEQEQGHVSSAAH